MTTDAPLGPEIETIVIESGIEQFLTDCMASIDSDDLLVRFFRRFALYNQPFPGGVVSLAGMIHLRPDLFRDADSVLNDNADRSSIIASNIFFAAEDEFAGPDRRARVTHRLMAQNMVEAAVSFAGWSPDRFNTEFQLDATANEIRSKLERGYRTRGYQSDSEIFGAIGFHLGSERLADIEFSVINAHLTEHFGDFVDAARSTRTQEGHSVYKWIELHATFDSEDEASVEIDHYNYSLLAAEQAIELCTNGISSPQLRQSVIGGFEEFIDFQRSMFQWINVERANA